MFVDHSSDKLNNAIIFFSSRTRFCGKVKLFKLLYLADFEAFRTSGSSTTGLIYEARKMGPVPKSLMRAWKKFEGSLADSVKIIPKRVFNFFRDEVVPLRGFDSSHFTARELRIMNEIADKYKNTFADALIDITHAENGAWVKVWQDGRGDGETIPYELSIPDSDPNKVYLLELSKEKSAAPL